MNNNAIDNFCTTLIRSDAKADFAKKAGADLIINTKKEDFIERVKKWTGGVGADVVIENLADDVIAKSIDAAKFMGVIGAFGFAAGSEVKFDLRNLFFAQKKLHGSMASNIEDLQFDLEQAKAGKIKPLLDRDISLKNTYEAHRLIANNEVSGNTVLLPWVN